MYGGGEAFIDETDVLTPADAALMMQLGTDGVFVAPGSSSPAILAAVSKSLAEPMVGIGIHDLPQTERLARRGG